MSPHRSRSGLTTLGISERRLLLLVSAVQFVNILDFMVVMPLGPDFARQLGIPLSHLGWLGGSYTASAALSGLLSARFLDRFDRRSALAVCMLGLVIGTACGGLASGLVGLMLARIVAGAFGGPATSLALSIIADVVPPERRGRALGIVMGAFSAATVLGLPAALELARLSSWRLPFFAIAALGALVAAGAVTLMPKLRLHLAPGNAAVHVALPVFLREPAVWLSLTATFTTMMAAFSVIPNISSFVQGNLHYPRERLGILYLAGGGTSFLVTRVVGPYLDRIGAAAMSTLGTATFITILACGFVYQLALPVPLIFMVFMSSMAIRNMSMGAQSTRVPRPHERARFMSIQSAVQHSASALGAFTSAQLLDELPGHLLRGMPLVASCSIALALTLPVLLLQVERRLVGRGAETQPAPVVARPPEPGVAALERERL